MTGRKCDSFFSELLGLLRKNGISYTKSDLPEHGIEFVHNNQRFCVTKFQKRNRRNKKVHYIRIKRQWREADGEFGRPEYRTTSKLNKAWKELDLDALLQEFRSRRIVVTIIF